MHELSASLGFLITALICDYILLFVLLTVVVYVVHVWVTKKINKFYSVSFWQRCCEQYFKIVMHVVSQADR